VEAARRIDADLTVASELPSTFQAARPDGLLTLDFANRDRTVAGALAFHAKHSVTAALGVDDDTAILAAAINAALGIPSHPPEAAERARDKHLQRIACATAGVPVPRFALCALNAAVPVRAFPFPCVVKPLRLAASRGVIRADDPDELTAAFARIGSILGDAASGHVLVEQFIPGREVALEGLVSVGTLRVLALFDKPDPLNGPFFEESIYVTPSRLASDEQQGITAVAQQAVAAIGLTSGPVHVELRVNDGGAWLIEIAARPIGGRCSAALRFGNDVSLEEIIIRQALGQPLPALIREAQASGVMMIPVPGAGVLREVHGVAAARAVPLVTAVDITARQGERLVPWPEGSRYPGFIFARGTTPAAVEAALRAALARLEFVLD